MPWHSPHNASLRGAADVTESKTKQWVPPYISFTTLVGLLDRMKEEGGAPPQIDPSYLDNFSGGYRSTVIASLKSLGLINDKGEVLDLLTTLVEAPDRNARETIIADLLRRLYPEPVRLGGIKATQGQLLDAFREHGIGGDTLRKAIAFYLGAANYAKVPVSSNFKVPSVAPADGKKAVKRKPRPDGGGASGGPEGGAESGSGSNHRPAADSWSDAIDPAILQWLKRIPPKDQAWTAADRKRWRSVLDAILDGIHGEDEGQ
jgi:hypothetical protein